MSAQLPRNPLTVTFAVWNALLLREALSRLFGRRAAWFWLLFEPIFHVAYLMLLFTVIRIRHVGGIATPSWLMLGLLAYFMFEHAQRQGMMAIQFNRALFVYRQVLPVDAVLVRVALEGTLMVVVSLAMLAGGGLLGLQVLPADPLLVLTAMLGLWLFGLGLGLCSSVVAELSPEGGKLWLMMMRPLYMISGVVFPIAAVPLPYRDWLAVNPLVHGLDAVRLGFAPYYHEVSGLSIAYLYECAIVFLLLGLILHVALARRIVAQ